MFIQLYGLMTTTTDTYPDYATGTWKLDLAHSEVNFTVKHLMISKVRGSFETFDVSIETHDDPKLNAVEAVIDVASVNTKVADRDNHLRTSDFFKVDEFPTMTFRSTTITPDGHDFVMNGELTLRGVTRPVTLVGEFGGIITDGWGLTRAAASATTTINRHDFGVSWNTALEAGGMTLGDDVTIGVELQVVLQQ